MPVDDGVLISCVGKGERDQKEGLKLDLGSGFYLGRWGQGNLEGHSHGNFVARGTCGLSTHGKEYFLPQI